MTQCSEGERQGAIAFPGDSEQVDGDPLETRQKRVKCQRPVGRPTAKGGDDERLPVGEPLAYLPVDLLGRKTADPAPQGEIRRILIPLEAGRRAVPKVRQGAFETWVATGSRTRKALYSTLLLPEDYPGKRLRP